MTAKTTRRVKRTGKKLTFQLTACGVLFLGLFTAVREVTLSAGMVTVPPATMPVIAAFITGIAAERYVF